MTPAEVLADLRSIGQEAGLNLAATISACGAFVSHQSTRRVLDRMAICRNLGGHSYCESGELLVWPDPLPLAIESMPEVQEFVRWSQRSEELRCCACSKVETITYRQLHLCQNHGAVRNRVPLCCGCERRLRWSERQPRVVVVGDVSPVPGALAFLGPSGDRLRGMINMDLVGFYQQVLPVNLFPSTAAVRPSRVPRRLFARLHGMAIEPVILDGRMPIVVFGRTALMGLPEMSPTTAGASEFDVGFIGRQRVLCVPHPSGRCHYWNLPENREKLATLFRELVAG